jgi:hypothetical protein
MPIELPLKPRQLHPTSKRQASKSSVSGSTGGKKNKVTNGLGAIARQEMMKEAQIKTATNKRVLVIGADGKRRFMLLSEYAAR